MLSELVAETGKIFPREAQMNRVQLGLSAILLVLVLVSACTPPPSPTLVPTSTIMATRLAPTAVSPVSTQPKKAAWEEDWDRTLAAAQHEGAIRLNTTAQSQTQAAIVQGLKAKYGLNVEALTAPTSQMAERMLRERRAGLYLVDVTQGGSTTLMGIVKPVGALDSLDGIIIRPDVLDPKVWFGGELLWINKEHQMIIAMGEPESTILINTNLVKPGEVKGYKDLINPKWKGKIVTRDLSTGGGSKWMCAAVQQGILDWNYMQQLANLEPVVLRDERLQVDWVVQGKMAIAVGMSGQLAQQMIDVGAPVQRMIPAEGTYLSSSAGSFAFINKAPHPNAAKIYINYLLTQEGQTILSKALPLGSRRLDVPNDHVPLMSRLVTGFNYFNPDNEESILKDADIRLKAKEMFAAYYR